MKHILGIRPRGHKPVSTKSEVASSAHTQFSRVCEVQLHGNKEFTLRQQKYKVSDILKTGEATVLFGMFCTFLWGFLSFSRAYRLPCRLSG